MNVLLMYQDHDFDLQGKMPVNEKTLMQDLELDTLFNAMAGDDKFLWEVAQKVILSGSEDISTICYRQEILRDCLKNSSVVRNLYDIATEAVKEKKKKLYFCFFNRYPSGMLNSARETLQMFLAKLKLIKTVADKHAEQFDSAGFKALFARLRQELSDQYFSHVQEQLRELQFKNGVLISAQLGKGNEGTDYTLHKIQEEQHSWLGRIFGKKAPAYMVHVHERDEAGARALGELRDRGISIVANVLSQSAEHINNFFVTLQTELAFYVGCLNLWEKLADIGEPIAFPVPVDFQEHRRSFRGLYDICLALLLKQRVVGNDLTTHDKDLVIITGANQGGKSTFLRSIGLAQLLMQCGMFVPAENFCANVCRGLFTHYRREEDNTMRSGKLDEELSRMSDIVDNIVPHSLLLFNESFAATNEREGSQIARQIVDALLEKHIQVFFVTHQYDLAHGFYQKNMRNAVFLRAQRYGDGERSFKLIEGEPLQTSFGEDLYVSIFGSS